SRPSRRRSARAAEHLNALALRSHMARTRDEIDEGPDDEDLERFGDDAHERPSCGRAVYDDLATCPHCYASLTSKRSSAAPPLWLVIVLGLVVCAMVAPLLFALL